MDDKINKNELNVLIIHPERVIFEGKAKAISSVNDKGTFDILPLHSNFVSLIQQKVVVHELNGTKREVPLEKVILKVYQNKIWVFVGITEDLAQLSVTAPVPA